MVFPSALPLHITRQAQPLPSANHSMAERAETKELEAEQEMPHLRRVTRDLCASLIFGAGSTACDVLAVIFIMLIIIVPGSAFVAITLCLGLGVMFGFIPVVGTISMLAGNAILKACHLSHYTNNATAGAIGATGSTILILPLLFIFPHLPTDEDDVTKMPPWYIRIVFHIFVTGLAGPLGAAVLRNDHGTDVLRAARAGVLGGVVLCPGSVALAPYIVEALREVLPYFGDAMKFGCHWISKHSRKMWEVSRRYKITYCSVPVTDEDD